MNEPGDLFRVGVIGLIKATDNFDTGLDVRFSASLFQKNKMVKKAIQLVPCCVSAQRGASFASDVIIARNGGVVKLKTVRISALTYTLNNSYFPKSKTLISGKRCDVESASMFY